MTPIKRPLAAAGAAVLLALSLSACGGSAPTDASVDDFCEATQNEAGGEEVFEAISEKDWDKVVDLIKDQANNLEEVGTPEDISDDAREGFEIQLDAAKSVDADDIEKAVEDDENPFETDVSDDDKEKVAAYTKYASETCADSGSAPETDTPTDVPSIDPSDLPSIDPSDIPSIDPSDLPSLSEEQQSQLDDLLSDLPTEE